MVDPDPTPSPSASRGGELTKRRVPSNRYVVSGQRVASEKVSLARRFRKEATVEEGLLWQQLRAKQVGGLRFRRQQIIDGYIADFYCPAVGLVVEVDGSIHKSSKENDAYRDIVLTSRSLRVLRVTNEEVRTDIGGVVRRINEAIASPLPVSGRGRGRGP